MRSCDKYYIDVGRAADLKDPREKKIYRAFEILPGALVWATLIGMVFCSWLLPIFTAFFIIAFCIYWLLRTTHFAVHLTAAYFKMKENLTVDWPAKLDTLLATDWKRIYQLVIFPMYREELRLLFQMAGLSCSLVVQSQ